MKFSIVTISYNQADFLEEAIRSVLDQNGVEVEYVVVDPGSSDGSRDIIERYRPRLAQTVLEKDAGPADGLNKGFALATGDVFAYLNSDDTFEPEAFARIACYFETHPEIDVVCGHAWVTDSRGARLRKVWSEPFGRWSVAYGVSVQIQPSTFIRSAAFRKSGGFNVGNRSNWDGELLIDLFLTGARIAILDEVLSCYRLHGVSITASGRLDAAIRAFGSHRFRKLMGRDPGHFDRPIGRLLKLWKHLRSPMATLERVRRGPLYKREA